MKLKSINSDNRNLHSASVYLSHHPRDLHQNKMPDLQRIGHQKMRDMITDIFKHLFASEINVISVTNVINMYIISGDYRFGKYHSSPLKIFHENYSAYMRSFLDDYDSDICHDFNDFQTLCLEIPRMYLIDKHRQTHFKQSEEVAFYANRKETLFELQSMFENILSSELEQNTLLEGFTMSDDGEIVVPRRITDELQSHPSSLEHACVWQITMSERTKKSAATRKANKESKLKKAIMEAKKIRIDLLHPKELASLEKKAKRMSNTQVEKMLLTTQPHKKLLGQRLYFLKDKMEKTKGKQKARPTRDSAEYMPSSSKNVYMGGSSSSIEY